MEFVIKVDAEGLPVGHPMTVENLLYVYPDISADNLPEGIEPFVRISAPQLGAYEVLVGFVGYARVNGVMQDTFEVRAMTDDEKAEKVARVMAMNHPEGWIFNEEKCAWRPVLNQPGSAPDVVG